jgi:hypothetical protein
VVAGLKLAKDFERRLDTALGLAPADDEPAEAGGGFRGARRCLEQSRTAAPV